MGVMPDLVRARQQFLFIAKVSNSRKKCQVMFTVRALRIAQRSVSDDTTWQMRNRRIQFKLVFTPVL